MAVLLASCTLSPGRYASYDEWTVGDPDRDYDLLRDQASRYRTLYGAALTPFYLVRDSLRIALVPAALTYHTLLGRIRAVRPKEGARR